jgi:hypothetical protein
MEQGMIETDFFSDPSIIRDSRPYFDALRAKGPIAREPFHDTLVVTGYNEALEILVNKEGVFSNACSILGPIPGLPFEPHGPDISAELDAHRGEMPWSDHLVCFDGKKHAENRMLLGSLLYRQRAL